MSASSSPDWSSKTKARTLVPRSINTARNENVDASRLATLRLAHIHSTSATDGLFVRNAGIPAYGRDERVPVKSFYGANEFWHRMMKMLSE
jgi:hypothetical protein